MNIFVKIIFPLGIILSDTGHSLFAQDSVATKKLKGIVKFNGYLKELQSAGFTTIDSMSTNAFIHNRLNLKFYPLKNFSGALEIRNRIYYGQLVQNTPGFGKLLDADEGFYKLSKLVVNEKSVVAHSMIDRLWIDWTFQKWEIRAGRQRINWGKTLVWNPNDLFNTFNYANFDYEEQPGSDALKVTYFPSGMSAVEFAIKPGRKKNETVATGVWRFNKHHYDFQFLGGVYRSDIAVGAGWAGNLKNAGFKGEATWFQPKDNLTDTTGVLSATASVDYSFKKPVYVHGGVLYNNHPGKKINGLFFLEQTLNITLSAKNLMPSDWSFFGQVSVNATPLLQAGVSIIYGTDPDFIFTMPSLTYSIGENWDITLLGQNVFIIRNNSLKSINNFYFRLKWSF